MALSTISNGGASQALPTAALQGSSPATKAPVASAAPTAPQQPSPEQVRQAVESMAEMIKATSSNSLRFSIDEGTGKTVVSVTDAETGEMVRQIPSKELLEIARSLDKLQGLLLKQKA